MTFKNKLILRHLFAERVGVIFMTCQLVTHSVGVKALPVDSVICFQNRPLPHGCVSCDTIPVVVPRLSERSFSWVALNTWRFWKTQVIESDSGLQWRRIFGKFQLIKRAKQSAVSRFWQSREWTLPVRVLECRDVWPVTPKWFRNCVAWGTSYSSVIPATNRYEVLLTSLKWPGHTSSASIVNNYRRSSPPSSASCLYVTWITERDNTFRERT